LYYYPSASSSVATILLWGRLATCGRLSIGLFVGQAILPAAGFQAALTDLFTNRRTPRTPAESRRQAGLAAPQGIYKRALERFQ
jgi:hypothetical protein